MPAGRCRDADDDRLDLAAVSALGARLDGIVDVLGRGPGAGALAGPAPAGVWYPPVVWRPTDASARRREDTASCTRS